MTPQQVINKLQEKSILLTQKNDELVELGEKAAQAKRDYAVAFATMIIALREEKQAATLIPDIARGDKCIAELRFKKDVAKSVFDAGKSSIRGVLASIDSLRSILTFEREELHNKC